MLVKEFYKLVVLMLSMWVGAMVGGLIIWPPKIIWCVIGCMITTLLLILGDWWHQIFHHGEKFFEREESNTDTARVGFWIGVLLSSIITPAGKAALELSRQPLGW